MTGAYLATAVLLVLTLGAVRFRRPAVSVPVIVMVAAAAGWNLVRAMRGPEDTTPSVLIAVNIVLVQICAVSFFIVCRRLAHGRWRVSAWTWIALVWIGAFFFVGMLPAMGITDGDHYYDSFVFVLHLVFSFGFLGAAILTLSARQHDPSPHVRRFIVATEVAAVLLVTTQVAIPALTSIVVGVLAILAVWTTGHAEAWSRSASRADRLLDSIGVFIFVIDREGRLQDWNGPAASLLELKGVRAHRDLVLADALSTSAAFTDGATVELDVRHGTLRMSVSVHQVDALARHSDLVLMLRPVRSSVDSSSFPAISGELQGHDPATQTLGRRAAHDLLSATAQRGGSLIRMEITPQAGRRADETMFLMARRIEARSAEEGLLDPGLARLDTWTFICPVLDPNRTSLAGTGRYEDLDIDFTVSVHQPRPDEPAESFISRVASNTLHDETNGKSAQG